MVSQRRPEVNRQLRAELPVILEVAGEVRPLLADVANGIDLAVGGPTEQERCEGVAAGLVEVLHAGQPVPRKLKLAQPATH